MPKVWMKVTNDKYELPLAIADTAKELATICHVSEHSIHKSHTYKGKGKYRRAIYICVKVEEDEDAERMDN